ncbi:N-acetylmuramoyl-L-alanine amidase family protein [Candidatus Ventrimonas sp. KK005]|nr:N-acetylmuramoyl-L-alanine amidase family protein [Lachnospiraceae bacterium]NBH17009.1 N-acetylmuramoyl-L-alanine amidase family protein [Clostridiaceae bacterium]
MMKKRKWIWTTALAAILMSVSIMTAAAADRVITSVTIRVNSKLEPGSTLPDIGLDSGSVESGEISVSSSTNRYTVDRAEWVTSTSRTIEVGDRPEMKVWLRAGSEDYFKGTYRSSNVSVKSGDFVSAKREDSDTLMVRIRVQAVKGNFAPPEDAYWKDNARGMARWEKPEDGDSGKYEVVLRRGSAKVHTVETTGTSYNFYPYMTTAGTYSFRVRTIAKTSADENYGKSSDWIESDELYIAKEDVSDGSGRTDVTVGPTGNTLVGWQYQDNEWYYYYPDGTCQRDSWLNVNDRWYLFQADGKMLKGWQNRDGKTYFLSDNGDMHMGWIQAEGRWYYMNPVPGDYFGAMVKNQWAEVNGKTYYFNQDGIMVEGWYQVGEDWYYFYPGDGNKAVNTWIDTFYVDENGIWRK